MKNLPNYRNGKYNSPITFAVKHMDLNTRMSSRSGGIFTALSDAVIDNGGIVYGCVLDEHFIAFHLRAECINDRNLMRGSKYIQSEMRDVFLSVKQDLDCDREVLFSGTSCQIAGLKAYLQKEYSKLICVDIVCHGVPSPLVWKEYLKWQERKNQSHIVSVDFRNKKDFGWKAHVESLLFENGKKVDSRVFTTLFYGHSILRPCCYKCPYKDVIHPGDITIADYWGIDQAAPGFNDNKGVSLVLINDDRGRAFFESIKGDLDVRETNIENSMQPPFKAPFEEPSKRNQFWSDWRTTGFERIARKYGTIGLMTKIKRKIKRILFFR